MWHVAGVVIPQNNRIFLKRQPNHGDTDCPQKLVGCTLPAYCMAFLEAMFYIVISQAVGGLVMKIESGGTEKRFPQVFARDRMGEGKHRCPSPSLPSHTEWKYVPAVPVPLQAQLLPSHVRCGRATSHPIRRQLPISLRNTMLYGWIPTHEVPNVCPSVSTRLNTHTRARGHTKHERILESILMFTTHPSAFVSGKNRGDVFRLFFFRNADEH